MLSHEGSASSDRSEFSQSSGTASGAVMSTPPVVAFRHRCATNSEARGARDADVPRPGLTLDQEFVRSFPLLMDAHRFPRRPPTADTYGPYRNSSRSGRLPWFRVCVATI